MRVCYFGTYESTYPRNQILIKGLEKNGAEVIQCHVPLWESTLHKVMGFSSTWSKLRILPKLLLTYLSLIQRHSQIGTYDVMIVGYPGHFDMLIAKILTAMRKRPLVFDAFLSLYDSMVSDRKVIPPASLKARLLHFIDRWACRLANIVLLDTNAHIDYFRVEFHLKKKKFRRIFIGTDDSHFAPRETLKESKKFVVIHYGKFIPLHGLQYIIEAAKRLERERDIEFQLIGDGQLFEEIRILTRKLRVKNVSFIGWVAQVELPAYIANADLCLGIFGDTAKAKRVIPNKVFECLAMKKAVITGDSEASSEVFTNGENILLCRMADSKAIADSILLLKHNKKLRTNIAHNGYKLFKNRFSPGILGNELFNILAKMIERKYNGAS